MTTPASSLVSLVLSLVLAGVAGSATVLLAPASSAAGPGVAAERVGQEEVGARQQRPQVATSGPGGAGTRGTRIVVAGAAASVILAGLAGGAWRSQRHPRTAAAGH